MREDLSVRSLVRPVERAVLGVLMTIVAFVLERRLRARRT
jgi:hypothetical protein